MVKGIKKILLFVNLLIGLALLLTAYASHIHPCRHPWASMLPFGFPWVLIAALALFLISLIAARRQAVLLSIFLLLCYPQIRIYCPLRIFTTPVPENAIKILSYNVMSFDEAKKEKGHNPILDYLKQSDADIICLQEYAVAGNSKFLTSGDVFSALRAYKHRHTFFKYKHSSGLACFSKYPIIDAWPMDYPSQYNGSMCYLIRMREDTLLLINNHLESNKLTKNDKNLYRHLIKKPNKQQVKQGMTQLCWKLAEASALRAIQADSVVKTIERYKDRYSIVACGDFNDLPLSYTHQAIAKQLHDAFVHTGVGRGTSYHENKFHFRIDHILASPDIQLYHCQVDNSIGDSDHYPIMCYFTLPRNVQKH